jgi:hypothetical protein
MTPDILMGNYISMYTNHEITRKELIRKVLHSSNVFEAEDFIRLLKFLERLE